MTPSQNTKNTEHARILNESLQENDFGTLELNVLIDHILQEYHVPTKEALDMLLSYGEKVVRVHGDKHPELSELYTEVTKLSSELLEHMRKEEKVLFPYIKNLVAAKGGVPIEAPHFRTIKNPLNVMDREHTATEGSLKNIEEISQGFAPPEGACNTYRTYYSGLQEFQLMTLNHIQLENTVLFPKAILLEEEVTSKN